MTAAREIVTDQREQFAFHDDIAYLAETKRGLTRATVEEISAFKGEPDWMLQYRLRAFEHFLKAAGTIVWNGPIGVFEYDQFASGTKAIAQAIASSNAFSIAGGGDTLAAAVKFGVADKISYISTGGGAFLEFLEGRKLPAVEILEQRAAKT